MAFSVATYNVLASSYIEPAWYPFTPPSLLAPEHRLPVLVRHLVGLDADVLCLQEVEEDAFGAFEAGLGPPGYSGHYTRKGGGKPDGCATFYRMAVFEPLGAERVDYRDGAGGRGDSGHIAQFVFLGQAGRTLGIANTHLKWDPPETPREDRYGYRQVLQLLCECRDRAARATAWIICGDLNATPESEVVAALRGAGLESAHGSCPRAFTCNSNVRVKTIDYLFHDGGLRANPAPLPEVGDRTPLPGPGQPSDHVAVVARFEWLAAPVPAQAADQDTAR